MYNKEMITEIKQFKDKLKVDTSINDIWIKFDKGIIEEKDLTDIQKEKLKELYKEKIADIDLEIINCRNRILNIKNKYLENKI